MKKQILTLILLLASVTVFAQSRSDSSYSLSSKKTTITKTVNETTGNQSYIGLSGGYLFKNNTSFENPMWYLDNGQFIELNIGMRGPIFGWSAALGYLTLKRNTGQFENIWLNNRMMYDSSRGGIKPKEVTSGLDNKDISFGPDTQDSSVSKPFKGFYLLTGPNIWIGDGKLKFNVALEGGIGFSQAGYYYVSGQARKGNGTASLEATDMSGDNRNYEVSVEGVRYKQYAMSKKYFDKLASSSLKNPLDEKESYEIHPIARLSANIEYFVTPRISIHGGANFWYIFSPKMTGQQTVWGERAGYINTDTKKMDYKHQFSYTQPFDQKDITNISANIGLKFWFGKPGSSKKVVTKEETTTSYEQLAQAKVNEKVNKQKAKSVMITVVDKLTKTPMGGVTVTLKGEDSQDDIHTVTKDNGTIELNNVAPGNYEVNGEIYNIATSSDHINSTAFSGDASTIHTTLLYNDPRFILKGVAINTSNGSVEKSVKVSLEKGSQKVSHTMSNTEGNFHFLLGTNSDYQIQGLKNGYYSNTADVSTKGLNRSQTLYVQLKIGMDTVEVGKSFVMKNILYDFDDASIRPDAALELDRLAAFLNENPDVSIELSSHTDSRGNNTYNMKLSQHRAQSAVNYLVSIGTSRNRLVAKGYGETRPVNGCKDGVSCTEAQYQDNRRTEIKILK